MSQIKICTSQTILSKELRNPDFPFLMEIRRSKDKLCRAPSKNKKIFLFVFIFIFVLCFGENKYFENYTHFIYLIKGTVLGLALWGC